MIQANIKLNLDKLKQINNFLDNAPRIVHDIGNRVLEQSKSDFLDELQDTPEKRTYPDDYPIEWTSEKQRLAYFATDGFGAGIPYRRTGSMTGSWTVEGIELSNAYDIVVKNPVPYAKFVVGLLSTAQSPYMQRFHKITGWQPAYPTVQFWFETMKEDFLAQWQKEVGDIANINVRQYT